MRSEFAKGMISLAEEHDNLVFLTNDLGYMALEGVSEKLGGRFINAGVAEQNMISIAAGLAYEGFIPWVYSIAPFAVLRPYEQIRNDVCLHNLPVKIVGNGGGFGYGIMGPTHHTLEDIGAMRVLPHMKVYVPVTSSDVAEAMKAMVIDPSPNYLRLNFAAKTDFVLPSFHQWRKTKGGARAVVISTGPVIQNVLEISDEALLRDLEIWSVGILPCHVLPEDLLESIRQKKRVVTLEEHYGQCGLNETIARLLLKTLDCAISFKPIYASGYPSGRHGSQRWHQEENGLAGNQLISLLREATYD